jgi:WD40 repeat protein
VDLGAPPLLMHGWHNLEFHPDGRHLYAVGQAGAVIAWDIDEQQESFQLESTRFLSFHMALSPDGRTVAVNADPQAATIFDTHSRAPLFRLSEERAPIWSLAFSPDNKRLALGLSDGGLVIWNLDSVQDQVSELGLNWD